MITLGRSISIGTPARITNQFYYYKSRPYSMDSNYPAPPNSYLDLSRTVYAPQEARPVWAFLFWLSFSVCPYPKARRILSCTTD
ncbi:hypothetical protein EMIT051CA3_10069 [Pseudomonas chlororaphis]